MKVLLLLILRILPLLLILRLLLLRRRLLLLLPLLALERLPHRPRRAVWKQSPRRCRPTPASHLGPRLPTADKWAVRQASAASSPRGSGRLHGPRRRPPGDWRPEASKALIACETREG